MRKSFEPLLCWLTFAAALLSALLLAFGGGDEGLTALPYLAREFFGTAPMLP